jgi:hypothetical protein
MSKKRKADDDTEQTETKKAKTSDESSWLDGVLGKKELEDLASKAPQEFKDDKQSFKEYEAVFSQIANRLLNEVVLMINGKPHRFIEIEFYYRSGNHPDHFTHGHPVQKHWGKWYFHRTSHSMTAYKAGTYKGMDISIGGLAEHKDSKVKEKTIHGGILIRAIQPLSGDIGDTKKKGKKGSFVEGPSMVVDHILKLCGSTSIEDFTKKYFKGQEHTPSVIGTDIFYITGKDKVDKLPKYNVYSSPRVGLTLKRNLEMGERLLLSSYRFHSLVNSASKGKHHLILSLHQQKKSAADISNIMATSKTTIEKYIDQFKAGGKSGKKLNSFGAGKKTLSTEDFAGQYGAWNAAYSAHL